MTSLTQGDIARIPGEDDPALCECDPHEEIQENRDMVVGNCKWQYAETDQNQPDYCHKAFASAHTLISPSPEYALRPYEDN